ncbi:MAG: hypothetical protein RIS79_3984 [Verrucomicrobiota bacterium]|jgi:type I restriction enzyme S subunit
MPAFSKYPNYKDSGVAWIGEVPDHWEVNALRACVALNVERNRPDLPVLSVYREYGVILKNSRDDNHNATSLDTSNYKVVHPGDLAVNKMKAWQGSLGVSEHHGIVSPAYITCKVNQSKVAGRYLHYLLRSKPLIGALDAISYGVRVGQWDMRFEDFKQVSLPHPPRAEQDRIVAFLDEKTAGIDRLIAKKQRQIGLLDEQKAILINRAVTRGVNRHAKLKDSGIDWIGRIPRHWKVMKLKYLARINPSVTIKPSDLVTSLPMERVGSNGSLSLQPSVEARSLPASLTSFSRGDVIIAKITPCFENGKGAELSTLPTEKGMGSTEFHVLRPLLTGSRFLRHLTSAPAWRRVAECFMQGTAGQKRVTTEHLANSHFPLPPPDEQEAIVTHIEVNAQAYLRLGQKVESQIQTLQNLRSTLIAHAVTGKITT